MSRNCTFNGFIGLILLLSSFIKLFCLCYYVNNNTSLSYVQTDATTTNIVGRSSPVQTDATLLANSSQHCWMLQVACVCTPCCMLLDVVAQNLKVFQPTTPNISFVPLSPRCNATMLDPFAQLSQHFWGLSRSLRMDYKDLWVVFFPRCTAGPKLVGSCCIRLQTTGNTHATTMLGVVAPVCTQPQPVSNFDQQHATTCIRVYKRTQHVTSNNAGSCWP